MFSLENNASKYGFIYLVKFLAAKGVNLIDCQQETSHLKSLGAKTITKFEFWKSIKENLIEERLDLSDFEEIKNSLV